MYTLEYVTRDGDVLHRDYYVTKEGCLNAALKMIKAYEKQPESKVLSLFVSCTNGDNVRI